MKIHESTLIDMKNVLKEHNYWDWFKYSKECYFPTYTEFVVIITSDDHKNLTTKKLSNIFRTIYNIFDIKYIIQEYCYLWVLFVKSRTGKYDDSVLKNLYNFERNQNYINPMVFL